jgi:chromatin segregation and condensation protein Rec8/ScpA/Scc1 (kleisin family)
VFEFDEATAVKEGGATKLVPTKNIAKPVDAPKEEPKKAPVKKVAEKVDTTDPEDVLFAKLPLLHKLINATEILDETKEELKDLLKKKKLTKKDRVIVEDILVNIYINNEMFKSDKPALQESKRAEIAQMLDSI